MCLLKFHIDLFLILLIRGVGVVCEFSQLLMRIKYVYFVYRNGSVIFMNRVKIGLFAFLCIQLTFMQIELNYFKYLNVNILKDSFML